MRTLLAAISRAIGRWDDLTHRPAYRLIGVAIGLLAFAAVLVAPSPEGLSPAAHRAGAVGLLMAVWWLGRVLPMAITALIPVIAFPLLGVLSMKDAALPYANPLNLLMLGGFVIGYAMEQAGLHRRLVAGLLKPTWIRTNPRRVVLALMLAAALLSGLVSNTATTLMLLPVAIDLAKRCTDDERLRSGFVLALAYGASIGGVSTLIGTPPNAILANTAPEITFARWTIIGVPFVVMALPIAWFVVTRVALPLPRAFEREPKAPVLPRWSAAEIHVVVVVVLAMIGWFTRKDIVLSPELVIPGWAGWLAPKWSHDALPAIAAAVLLFFVPASPQQRETGRRSGFLITPHGLEKGVPWSVLLLLGGGFSLAAAVEATELTRWLAGATDFLKSIQNSFGEGSTIGLGLAVLVLCLVMTFLTELTSNTATTQIVIPVLAVGAAAASVDPMLWMVPATISASCAFMMPVATAPNAIASQAGDVAPGDMAWAGLILNFTIALVAAGITLVLVPLAFPG